MLRSTKIVATLGPASSDPQTLERMILAGVDVVRLNFSHGKAEDHVRRADLVREISRKISRPTEDEIARNPRARSARLRVAESIAGRTAA